MQHGEDLAIAGQRGLSHPEHEQGDRRTIRFPIAKQVGGHRLEGGRHAGPPALVRIEISGHALKATPASGCVPPQAPRSRRSAT